jgi:Fe-S cluster assembly scaffold protein SufB
MSCNNPKITINYPPILDRGEEGMREIRVMKWECQKYLLFPNVDGIYERRFIVEEWAIFRWAGIALWANMALKMTVSIEWSDAEGSLLILGLAQSDTEITLDGVGRASPGCENVKLRVDQTNILLGNGAKVKGRPVLEVSTDSIEWGHSCRIHRISGDALFYLESHGIDTQTAEGMLLEAEIHRCTDLLEETWEDMKREVLEKLGIKKEV